MSFRLRKLLARLLSQSPPGSLTQKLRARPCMEQLEGRCVPSITPLDFPSAFGGSGGRGSPGDDDAADLRADLKFRSAVEHGIDKVTKDIAYDEKDIKADEKDLKADQDKAADLEKQIKELKAD